MLIKPVRIDRNPAIPFPSIGKSASQHRGGLHNEKGEAGGIGSEILEIVPAHPIARDDVVNVAANG